MAGARPAIYEVFISLGLFNAGSSMLGISFGDRMPIDGFPAQWIGPILAFYSLGFVLGTLYAVGIIRRVGHIRSFAAFAAIACITTLAHPLWVNGYAWAALRLLMGFCGAGLVMVMESWIKIGR